MAVLAEGGVALRRLPKCLEMTAKAEATSAVQSRIVAVVAVGWK